MTSLGLMRYSHPALVDSIITWYQSSSMEIKDMTTLIITLASINYSGVSAQALLDSVTGQLQSSSLPDHVWLDTVWSLTVLGRVTPQQVQSVLDSSFSNNILCKYLVSPPLYLLDISLTDKRSYVSWVKITPSSINTGVIRKDSKIKSISSHWMIIGFIAKPFRIDPN